MKKIYYFLAVTIVCALLVVGGFLFLTSEKASTMDQKTTLTIQPNTLKEQKELVDAQERDESSKIEGPLVAFTTVSKAEARVLNRK